MHTAAAVPADPRRAPRQRTRIRLGGPGPAGAAPDPHLAWAERFRAIHARIDAIDEDDPEVRTLWLECGALEARILNTPARTFAGIAEQLRLVRYRIEYFVAEVDDGVALGHAVAVLERLAISPAAPGRRARAC